MSESNSHTNVTSMVTRQKADIGSNVLGANAMSRESGGGDKFTDQYDLGVDTLKALKPVLAPEIFRTWARSSDALPPCISAMVVNVEQTGWDIIPEDFDRSSYDDEELEKDKELQKITDIFKNPWPGKSFIQIRSALREDLEETGNGYIEVIRNKLDEILFFNNASSEDMRLCPLGEATVEEIPMTRGGQIQNFKIETRRRLYVQIIGANTTYFKEFGDTRIINKDTGRVMGKNDPQYNTHRASEIIHFTAVKDPNSPYGLPRWFHASPSVVGSRAAEELNVEFFEAGGIPPVLIFLSGGEFNERSREHLEGILSGKAKSKLSAAIIEAYSTGGSFDKDTPPKIDVQKFGADSQKDSMFEGYIDKCERRIRKSFRLPPLFVGKAEDYSYATAFASYTVAEEQVFSPERHEVDDQLTMTMLSDRSLGAGKYILKSRALTVKDVESRFKALQFVASQGWVSPEDTVNTFNRMLDMSMAYDKEGVEESKAQNKALSQLLASGSGDPANDDPEGEEEEENPEGEEAAKTEIRKTASRIDRITEVADLVVKRVKEGDTTPIPAYRKLSKADQKVVTTLVVREVVGDFGDLRRLKSGGSCC